MKSLIIAAYFVTATIFSHAATGLMIPRSATDKPITFVKSQMNLEELPEGVVKTLDGARFTGWKPIVAYLVKTDNTDYYEITFVRGDELETLKLNSAGGKIG